MLVMLLKVGNLEPSPSKSLILLHQIALLINVKSLKQDILLICVSHEDKREIMQPKSTSKAELTARLNYSGLKC
jgi:hypothetical protein